MTYATGACANATDAINAIESFALANGWTVNYSGADGSNRRLHISKNGNFANFSTNYQTTNYMLAMCGSSGFAGSGSAWNAQTAPVGALITLSSTVSVNMFPCTYHAFAQTTPDMLAFVFSNQSDQVRQFIIGGMEKVGTYTGGDFYAEYPPVNLNGSGVTSSASCYAKNNTGTFYNTVHWGLASAVDTATVFAPLVPVRCFQNTTGSKYRPMGWLPWVRTCARLYGNGDELTYGGDVWKVFFASSITSAYMCGFKK